MPITLRLFHDELRATIRKQSIMNVIDWRRFLVSLYTCSLNHAVIRLLPCQQVIYNDHGFFTEQFCCDDKIEAGDKRWLRTLLCSRNLRTVSVKAVVHAVCDPLINR
jgi:hypothetical protein